MKNLRTLIASALVLPLLAGCGDPMQALVSESEAPIALSCM